VERTCIQCEHCSTRLSIPESAVGKKIRCPSCQSVVLVSPAKLLNDGSEQSAPAPKAESRPNREAEPASGIGSSKSRPVAAPKDRTDAEATAARRRVSEESKVVPANSRPSPKRRNSIRDSSNAVRPVDINRADPEHTHRKPVNRTVLIACVSVIGIAIIAAGFAIFRNEQAKANDSAQRLFEDAKKALVDQNATAALSLLRDCIANPNLSLADREAASDLLTQLEAATSAAAIESTLMAMDDTEFSSTSVSQDITNLNFNSPEVNKIKKKTVAELIPSITVKRKADADARANDRKTAKEKLLQSENELTILVEAKILQYLNTLKVSGSPGVPESPSERFHATVSKLVNARQKELLIKSLLNQAANLEDAFPVEHAYIQEVAESADPSGAKVLLPTVIGLALTKVKQVCVDQSRSAADELFDVYWEHYRENVPAPARWMGSVSALADVWCLFVEPKYNEITFGENRSYAVHHKNGLIDNVITPISHRLAPNSDIYVRTQPIEGSNNVVDIISVLQTMTYSRLLSNEEEIKSLTFDRPVGVWREDITKGAWDTVTIVRKTGSMQEMVVKAIPGVGWECGQRGFIAPSLPELLHECQDLMVRNSRFRSPDEVLTYFAPVTTSLESLGEQSDIYGNSTGFVALARPVSEPVSEFYTTVFALSEGAQHITDIEQQIPMRSALSALRYKEADPTSNSEQRLLRIKAPSIPRWLVFEDKLEVKASSTAGQMAILRTEVLPVTKEVAFTCSLAVANSGAIELSWSDRTDPRGANGTIKCQVRYFRPMPLRDLMDGDPKLAAWHREVESISERTALQNTAHERQMVLHCALTSPILGVASYPAVDQSDGGMDWSSDGEAWILWKDANRSVGGAPPIFANPSTDLYLRAIIPPKAKVPLSFLYSKDLNVWLEASSP